ncbi:MAG: aquaporin [Planctomycetes bacterium]|nr:aquaporin [Planctomycetota bacterium]
MNSREPSLLACCLAELVGTAILIFLGCGSVHAAVTTGALQGSWQVAIIWGSAVILAAYAVGPISGAHINPAISLSLALWNGFPRRRR